MLGKTMLTMNTEIYKDLRYQMNDDDKELFFFEALILFPILFWGMSFFSPQPSLFDEFLEIQL